MTIFEKIVKREIPAKIIYEDDDIISFLDVAPVCKGHCLVIPKVAYKNLYEMPDNIIAKLFSVCKILSIKLKQVFNADGINLINNNDAAAGQVVFHYHVHILPRFKNDGVNLQVPRLDVKEDELISWHKQIINFK